LSSVVFISPAVVVVLRNISYNPLGRRMVVGRTTHSFMGRWGRREALRIKKK